jgi:hypothetical protein
MDTPIAQDNPVLRIPQPEFTSKGVPKSPKLKEPSQVRSLWLGDWQADTQNRLSRAHVQGMCEAKPPYNPQRMAEAGLAGCCNIDWRYGQLAIRKKMKPYVLMLNSMPVFLNIKTKYGNAQQKATWGKIMSEKFSRLLRSWESFVPRHLANVNYLVQHGASFCYFNDDTDWRWNVATMGDMVVPRLTKADANDFPRLSMERDYDPSYLWEEIKEAATNKEAWTRPDSNDGWNVAAVKEAICQATYKEFFKTDDYEQNEMLWKNKETTYSQSAKIVKAIMMWFKEDDGKVSQYIVTKNQAATTKSGKAPEEFLYKRPSHFSSMRQGVVTFTRDIGTNGFFHSIRGTGSDIFPIVQKLNEMECAAYDAMKIEMSIPVSAPDEVWNTEMAYVQAGPFLLMHEQVKIHERGPRNYSNSVFPGLQMLKMNLAEQSGDSQMPETPGNKAADLTEMLSSMSELDIQEAVLFFIPWQRLLRESLRRVIAIKNQIQPGGQGAMEFRKLCLEANVPEQAIDQIDIEDCCAERAIGNGSPQAQVYSTQAMKELVPFMDAQGRNNWVRDTLAALPGMHFDLVNRYAPEMEDARPTQELRNALRENVDLKMIGANPEFLSPQDVPVLPNDDHITHLEAHAPAMESIVELVDQGQMGMEQAVRPLYPLYMHANEHITLCMDNPVLKAEIAKFRQAMHNVGEIITNGQRKLQAQQQKAEENAAKGLDPDGNPLGGGDGTVNGERPIYPDPLGSGQMLTPSEFSMVARTQIHLQDAGRNAAIADALHRMKIEEIAQDSADKRREAAQKRQLRDAQTAANIQMKREAAALARPKGEKK